MAGKRLEPSAGAEPTGFELLVAGRYTLEANGPVRLDNRLVRPCQSLDLAKGAHQVVSLGTAGPVTLRWGEGLYRPVEPPFPRPFFLGF